MILSLELIGSEIEKVTTETKNKYLAGTDNKINFKICQNGNCCQTNDMPLKNQTRADKNEFSGTEISNCRMKKLYVDLSPVNITVTKTGSNEWYLRDIHIETKFKSTYHCNFNEKIDSHSWSGQDSSTKECTGTQKYFHKKSRSANAT